MRRDGGSVFPALANTGDPNGPFEARPLTRLTNGKAIYGKPGYGCRGPYGITRFEVKVEVQA